MLSFYLFRIKRLSAPRVSVKQTNIIIAIPVIAFYIFLSIRPTPLLESLERIIYSTEMRLDLPGSTEENKIAIVDIDDKSIKQLGPWPWPRHLIAEMINILKSNGAKLIGLDLIFSQKEQNQGLNEIKQLYSSIIEQQKTSDKKPSYDWFLERLEKIEKNLDNDKKLSDVIKSCGNIVLPVVGEYGRYDTELVIPIASFLENNAMASTGIGKDFKTYTSVKELTTPFPELSKNSRGLGHINLSPNDAMRGQVHLPFINYRGHIIPSMPFRLALDYLNRYPEQTIILNRGIKLDDKTIPMTDKGIFVRFKGGRRSFPSYSFCDILKVKKVPAVFNGKIVLIGFTAQEGGVAVNTPVDPKMPRVEFTANIIDGFIGGRYLTRPKAMVYFEALLLAILCLFSSFFLPRLKFFPRTIITGAALFVLFLVSLIFFMSLDIWFKIVYISFSLLTLHFIFSIKELIISEKSIELTSKESIEMNRMLGLSLQSQGLLDLAFEKLRALPLDDAMKDVLYNLGLDFERKRMFNKAMSVYTHISHKGDGFRDLDIRIPRLKKLTKELPLGIHKGEKDEEILLSDDLTAKPTVGRYEILGKLGQGAMGVVYKARDPKINRLVAIKTLRFADDFEEKQIEEVKARFFKEAELAGTLSHPSIIAIHDLGEDYELSYMAMELLEGKDLDAFCTKETLLPLRKVLAIIAEAAMALDYAHSRGIVHRDIKPGNIMLLKNGKVKVTDFGIAKAVSSSMTKTGIILGTPNYMAPEQINGEQLDGRSDIFSLGVVFFQLLTGKLPFHSKTIAELFYQITQVKHPSPRAINPKVLKQCEQLIDKAMEKDPEKRFKRAGDFAKYLKILGEKIDMMIEKRK